MADRKHTDHKHDAPSESAQRIEDKLVKETGKSAGDPDKPVNEKFDEMGERDDIRRKAGRE